MFTLIIAIGCLIFGWWARGEEIKRDLANKNTHICCGNCEHDKISDGENNA
jgi:hypothetical protein